MTSEVVIDVQQKDVAIALCWQHLHSKGKEAHAGSQCLFCGCGL